MTSTRRGRAALLCLLLAGCGAKSSLPAPGDRESDAEANRRGRNDRDGEGGAGGDAHRPDPPCALESAGDPFLAADFPEGNANSPFVVATQSGEGGTAKIVLQAVSQDANFWHPELRLSRWAIGADWPGGATLEQGFTLAGVDAHASGRLGFLPGGRVGLAWFRGDEAAGLPSGLKFRPIEPDAWAFGDEVFVDEDGELPYAIAPFNGHPDTDWAMSYRGTLDDLTIETRVAIVSARGELVGPPIVVAGARDYPGVVAEPISTGERWLVAASFGACIPSDPVCEPNAVVVEEVATGDDTVISQVASFPVATAGHAPRRPALARDGDLVWIAWSETLPDDDLAPRRIVIAAVDASGAVAIPPRAIADGVIVNTGVQVAAGPDGPIVTWGGPGDAALPPESVGHSTYFVHHERASGPPRTAQLPTTAFAYSAGSPAAELRSPRSVIVSWGANIAGQQRTGVWLARLDCH